jgi:hypothetical protein
MVTSRSKKSVSKSTGGLAPLDALFVTPTLISLVIDAGGSPCLPEEPPHSPLFEPKPTYNKHPQIKKKHEIHTMSQISGFVTRVQSYSHTGNTNVGKGKGKK